MWVNLRLLLALFALFLVLTDYEQCSFLCMFAVIPMEPISDEDEPAPNEELDHFIIYASYMGIEPVYHDNVALYQGCPAQWKLSDMIGFKAGLYIVGQDLPEVVCLNKDVTPYEEGMPEYTKSAHYMSFLAAVEARKQMPYYDQHKAELDKKLARLVEKARTVLVQH